MKEITNSDGNILDVERSTRISKKQMEQDLKKGLIELGFKFDKIIPKKKENIFIEDILEAKYMLEAKADITNKLKHIYKQDRKKYFKTSQEMKSKNKTEIEELLKKETSEIYVKKILNTIKNEKEVIELGDFIVCLYKNILRHYVEVIYCDRNQKEKIEVTNKILDSMLLRNNREYFNSLTIIKDIIDKRFLNEVYNIFKEQICQWKKRIQKGKVINLINLYKILGININLKSLKDLLDINVDGNIKELLDTNADCSEIIKCLLSIDLESIKYLSDIGVDGNIKELLDTNADCLEIIKCLLSIDLKSLKDLLDIDVDENTKYLLEINADYLESIKYLLDMNVDLKSINDLLNGNIDVENIDKLRWNMNKLKLNINKNEIQYFYFVLTYIEVIVNNFNKVKTKRKEIKIHDKLLILLENFQKKLETITHKERRNPLENEIFHFISFLELKYIHNIYKYKNKIYKEWIELFENLSIEEKAKIKKVKIDFNEKIDPLEMKYSEFKTDKIKDNNHKEKMEEIKILLEKNDLVTIVPKNKEFIKLLYYLIYKKNIKLNTTTRTPTIKIVLNNQQKNKNIYSEKFYEDEYINGFRLALLQSIIFEKSDIENCIKIKEEILKIISTMTQLENYDLMSKTLDELIDSIENLLEKIIEDDIELDFIEDYIVKLKKYNTTNCFLKKLGYIEKSFYEKILSLLPSMSDNV